jgi:TPR repeat protein
MMEIEPQSDESHFQRTYTNQQDYENETGLFDEIVGDLVPYLQCMIGYMADTYFWSSAGLAPHLPLLVVNGTINTDGMKYLVDDSREYYDRLLLASEENAKNNPFMQQNLLNLYEGSAELWSEEIKQKTLESLFLSYCSTRSGMIFSNTSDAVNKYVFNIEDRQFLLNYIKYAPKEVESCLKAKLGTLNSINFDYNILNSCDTQKLLQLSNNDSSVALYRLGELYDYSIGVKANQEFAELCYDKSEKLGFILATYKKKLSKEFPFTKEDISTIELLHNSGIQQASFIFAEIYWRGLGVSKSIDFACEVLNSITDSQHPFYYYLASMILLDGYGSEEKVAIYRLLKKSADMGYVKAQEKMMMIYTIDEFVPTNPKLHFEYARRAAEQGSMAGITRMGYCYAKGYGVSKSLEKAEKILSIAVRNNYNDAITLMNIIHRK